MTVKSRRKIKFRHVGSNISERKFSELVPAPTTPLGIKTPVRIGSSGLSNLFDMHFQPADQLHDNLKNLIKTNHGERLGRFDLGANLRSLTFDLARMEDFEESAINNIRITVEKFMPIIEVSDIEINTVDHEKDGPLPPGIAKILLTIVYNIPRLKIIGKKLQAIIYAGG